MEIERKFMLNQIPDITSYPSEKIIQAYISTDPVIRIRQMGTIYYLTVKSHGHLVREEFELPITKEQFLALWPKIEFDPIEKTRYFIPIEDGFTAELDIYEGHLNGLMTVEVEFNTKEEASHFQAPEWFGKDITHDSRYKNNLLSMYGLPKNLGK